MWLHCQPTNQDRSESWSRGSQGKSQVASGQSCLVVMGKFSPETADTVLRPHFNCLVLTPPPPTHA